MRKRQHIPVRPKIQLPTVKYLQECFHIGEDGRLYWGMRLPEHFKPGQWNCWVGKHNTPKLAGCVEKNGVWRVMLDGKIYVVARILWKMRYGRAPRFIGYKDGNPFNCCIDNLIERTRPLRANSKLKPTPSKFWHYPGKYDPEYGVGDDGMWYVGKPR